MEQQFKLPAGGRLTAAEQGGRVTLTATCPGDGRGLYKAWALGRTGRLELGTMTPAPGGLTVMRTLPRVKLEQAGCWPLSGGEIALVYAFDAPKAPTPPEWQATSCPGDLFPRDPVLGQAAGMAERALLRRSGDGFFLALPYGADRPFHLTPLFCLCTVEQLHHGTYAIFRFDAQGAPQPPDTITAPGR